MALILLLDKISTALNNGEYVIGVCYETFLKFLILSIIVYC